MATGDGLWSPQWAKAFERQCRAEDREQARLNWQLFGRYEDPDAKAEEEDMAGEDDEESEHE